MFFHVHNKCESIYKRYFIVKIPKVTNIFYTLASGGLMRHSQSSRVIRKTRQWCDIYNTFPVTELVRRCETPGILLKQLYKSYTQSVYDSFFSF